MNESPHVQRSHRCPKNGHHLLLTPPSRIRLCSLGFSAGCVTRDHSISVSHAPLAFFHNGLWGPRADRPQADPR